MTPQHIDNALTGRRALVTGAGRGIGRSIALALAAAGADVAITSRSPNEIEQVAVAIRERGRSSLAVPCDVTDVTQVTTMVERITDEFGLIDILVNNAGSGGSHKFINHPDDLWHQMMDVNLNSVYYVTKAVVPGMAEQRWGRVINIASVASKVGAKYVAAYTAAKHGVLGLTRALAVEFATQGVTVNAICPGYVDTPMTDDTIARISALTGMSEDEARATLEKTSPQRRLIEADEIAAMTVFLAQDAARGITGQGINIDGGAVMF
ncbi:MAG: SDR family oxidoreductase [Chloroflexi bacterium]|nr:MAG: SDR family oxidoreductase [Chloroflexota bacterium]